MELVPGFFNSIFRLGSSVNIASIRRHILRVSVILPKKQLLGPM